MVMAAAAVVVVVAWAACTSRHPTRGCVGVDKTGAPVAPPFSFTWGAPRLRRPRCGATRLQHQTELRCLTATCQATNRIERSAAVVLQGRVQ